jgi:F-type H+-transporting ATPase subunit gamma
MISKKAIINELDRLESIKTLVESYQEITATRMRKIRSSVLNTRQFLEGVNAIFNQVKKSYKNEVDALMKKSKGKNKDTFLIKNGRKVTVLISANSGLYGDIVRKSFLSFAEEVRKEKTDMVIIGKQGKFLFNNSDLKGNPVLFDLPDNHLDQQAVAKIVKYILNYETIIVCYGRFLSVIKQEPTRIVISGRSNETTEKTQDESVKYLFEPSIQRILQFFETEIFASLFEETVNESHLAKFASRLITLDEAVENVKKSLKQTQYQKRVLFHRAVNKKQLEAISGVSVLKGNFYG